MTYARAEIGPSRQAWACKYLASNWSNVPSRTQVGRTVGQWAMTLAENRCQYHPQNTFLDTRSVTPRQKPDHRIKASNQRKNRMPLKRDASLHRGNMLACQTPKNTLSAICSRMTLLSNGHSGRTFRVELWYVFGAGSTWRDERIERYSLSN